MNLHPQLVDYSQISIGENIVKKRIYTRTQRISIFLNGLLIITILTGICFMYYRFITKNDNEKNINNKIMKLNNLIYS